MSNSTVLDFQQTVGFLLEGRGGDLSENDHEFPFADDVELLRRSLTDTQTITLVW